MTGRTPAKGGMGSVIATTAMLFLGWSGSSFLRISIQEASKELGWADLVLALMLGIWPIWAALLILRSLIFHRQDGRVQFPDPASKSFLVMNAFVVVPPTFLFLIGSSRLSESCFEQKRPAASTFLIGGLCWIVFHSIGHGLLKILKATLGRIVRNGPTP